MEDCGIASYLSPPKARQTHTDEELKHLSLAIHLYANNQGFDLKKNRLCLPNFKEITQNFNPVEGQQVNIVHTKEEMKRQFNTIIHF